MTNGQEHDFLLERRLMELDPSLHRRFTDAVFALQHILSNYKLIFPEYTDHTELHSLTVIDFCNRLIGSRIDRLSADEIYVLLMGCYFHDTGMGVSEKDFAEFSKDIDFGDYFLTHSGDDKPRTIRDFHNEFSGRFINKYADFFEIPSKEHLFAVIEISRGHRKTYLTDEKQYPIALPLPNGGSVCLPYLSALIRLADEIDVAAARNPIILYDIGSVTDPKQIIERKKHLAVRDLMITDDAFTLLVKTDEQDISDRLAVMVGKMQKTLDECREAVIGRTPFTITQERVLLKEST
ncbi:MAG: hypothetical protein J5854_00650 [Clostridia bacterium]|nr:hypothetical protein [Clostridia bacterium]